MAQGKFNNPVVAALAGFYDIFRKQALAERFKDTDNFNGKTVVITGANSGLGFAMAVEAAKRNARVIMACRSQIPEAGGKVKKLSGSSNVEMRYLDLTKIKSMQDFVAGLKRDSITLDVTILNAASAAAHSRKTEAG